MKHETDHRSPSRRFGLSFIACVAAISTLCAGTLSAGLININFTDTTASGLASEGPGILGVGTWNRIIDTEAGTPKALFDSASAATGTSISQTSGTAVAGKTQANGNAVQSESWFDAGGFILTVNGLIPSHVYKIALYSDRIGSGGPDTYTVGGIGKTLPSPGAAPTGLPGVVDVDYGIFEITSTAAGQLAISCPYSIAGLQIQGVLDGEDGPQIDCKITKSSTSSGGKGDGAYKVRSTKKQTISKKVKGTKAVKTYVNVENDGDEIDSCYLMGFWKNKHFKKVVIKDRATGNNVTAATLAQTHRFTLDVGATKGFFVKAKRAQQRSGATSLQVCSSPSTLVGAQQDCVTTTIK